MKLLLTIVITIFSFVTKGQQLDNTENQDQDKKGVKYIDLKEGYKIWTKRVGDGKIIILLIHGSGNNHHCFEIFRDKLDLKKYQLIYYDQLGSNNSDKPTDSSLYNIDRFVNEVEQLRIDLELNEFYILGHSWGGALAMEYAIKYPNNVKGLIISNKGYSTPNLINSRVKLWNEIAKGYASGQEIIKQLESGKQVSDTSTLKKIDLDFERRYLRTIQPIPEPMVNSRKNNRRFYITNYSSWDIYDRLQSIKEPTLLIGGDRDFVDKHELFQMKKVIPDSYIFICPNGGHFSFWDDSDNYFREVENFINKTENK
ncbi:MAG: proline iminopeptidase-family hydrolase [Cyclobacteriaceae bacterium]|nr:MAG: proline iminopeptidase-family hydrolase [Cyclobacteriaceae bacterium]